jgi:hypothetical protein
MFMALEGYPATSGNAAKKKGISYSSQYANGSGLI